MTIEKILNEKLFMEDVERFPIRILSEQTKVGTSTLRAWERRYGLLKPQRTPKGHRLYRVKDIERVQKILALINDGHSLADIGDLLSPFENVTTFTDERLIKERHPSVWNKYIQSTLDAAQDFNIERIDAVYNEASASYPVDLLTDKLIQPCLDILGNAWKKNPEGGIAEEHFYTAWLKNRLGARFHHAYALARGSRIICACLPGSNHEVGLMLFALSILYRGYRVLYFGADLPLSQLPHITKRSAAKAIILGAHIQMEENINRKLTELITSQKIPVFIGGSNPSLNIKHIETAGGIFLGTENAIALRVFERHIPLHLSDN